jgi:hypothetical protein
MLVNGGAGLNLISPNMIKRLHIPDKDLEETGSFQGISLGRNKPKGQVTLLVTFGGELNYRTEKITFDVVKMPLPYNGILGHPTLAKFMAASHYAYNVIKMPGLMGVLTIKSNHKDMIICTDKLYREAVAAAAIVVLAPAVKAPGEGKKKKTGKTSSEAFGKRTSECSTPIKDIPKSSTGKSKKTKASPPATKQVSAREDGTGDTFTVSATLDGK